MLRNTMSNCGILIFMTAVMLPAQNRGSHPDDANGDGIISRTEWRGDPRSFRDQDRNRDGVLSGNEVPGIRENEENADWHRTHEDVTAAVS